MILPRFFMKIPGFELFHFFLGKMVLMELKHENFIFVQSNGMMV